MKKLFTILLIVFSFVSIGQHNHQINFDDPGSLQCITIDTISNPNNVWQIGQPQKNVFTSAFSIPNAIVTDTLNPYPINDTSSFIIKHEIIIEGGSYESTELNGYFFCSSDTNLDYSFIDYSFNKGETWNNLVDKISGNYNDWTEFGPIYFYADNLSQFDTIYFKFTFISDDIQTNKDGVMFDNIIIYDEGEGVEENSLSQFKTKVYPDPADNFTTIAFDNIKKEKHLLKIFNNEGRKIDEFETFENKHTLNTSQYSSGIYFYKIENKGSNLQATRKFIKR